MRIGDILSYLLTYCIKASCVYLVLKYTGVRQKWGCLFAGYFGRCFSGFEVFIRLNYYRFY